MQEATETSRTMYNEYIKEQLNSINKTSINNNLYSFMENEIIQLNKLVDIKHNQLEELFILNKILIRRLFKVEVELKYLEERADSAEWGDHVDRMSDDRLSNIAKEEKPNTTRPPTRWYESWSSSSQMQLGNH
ncbi:uncharacterized protein LOC130891842 [Diorhabda carinulata]|uniref:uncharacterized protein LOC130891842 n=1 Tax=Diorhabda carinulata TaxID=1163345 RepID=UPI0025A12A16|nr:uncharacterized protein LOC130891842 [Diorhabda carinulata]